MSERARNLIKFVLPLYTVSELASLLDALSEECAVRLQADARCYVKRAAWCLRNPPSSPLLSSATTEPPAC